MKCILLASASESMTKTHSEARMVKKGIRLSTSLNGTLTFIPKRPHTKLSGTSTEATIVILLRTLFEFVPWVILSMDSWAR